MNDKELDAAIAASPSSRRVMREDIDANVKAVNYYRHETLTIAIITMANGFNVIGESACIDPANYRQDIGETIAYKSAYEKLWSLEAYAMASRLLDSNEAAPTSFLDRMRGEYTELSERFTKLRAFIESPGTAFSDLPLVEQDALRMQEEAMGIYAIVLFGRISRADNTPDAIAE